MQSQTMDRGSQALKAHLQNCSKMDVRGTKRGWFQDCLGCEAKREFRYVIGDNQQVAHSMEEANFCCRLCCVGCHAFQMVVKEDETDAELLTVNRPFRCTLGCCKCCCHQTMTVSSDGHVLGSVTEDCWFCVPGFTIRDYDGNRIYKMHQPTCCGGILVNCCAEGNPCCGRGCCKVPFHIFPESHTTTTNEGDFIGKIVKKPKSAAAEIFTEACAFEVDFPNDATVDQKGILVGTAVFINAMFFEGNDSDEAFS